MSLILGQKIGGRYHITKNLGGGGFSFTFVAEDLQRPGHPQCVVKQFKPQTNDPYTLSVGKTLFNREAEVQENLGNHDRIPRLLAHFEENDEFYLVQEYIPGHDLKLELLPNKKLSEAYTLKLLEDILEVLAFVHENDVIHRDIKPSNLLRRESDSKIILIDFGAVKQITSQVLYSQGLTNSTVIIGTPGYMPNEQAKGCPKFSSDIYAVGMIGVQALTGVQPLKLPKDSQTGEIVWRNLVEPSPDFADFLDKMLRYDHLQRYQSADEALQALKKLAPKNLRLNHRQKLPNIEISAAIPSINIPPTHTSALLRKFLISLGIVVVLSASLVWLYFLNSSTQEKLVTYENNTFGLKMKYPKTWERQDIEDPITGEVVRFVSPKQNDADKFQETLTIKVQPFSGTMEEFSNASIQEINSRIAGAKLIDNHEKTLANKLGQEIIFTRKDKENNLQNLEFFTLKHHKAYIITYTGKASNYERFLPIIETMIKSFELLPI